MYSFKFLTKPLDVVFHYLEVFQRMCIVSLPDINQYKDLDMENKATLQGSLIELKKSNNNE